VTGTSFKADIDVGNDLCRAYYMWLNVYRRVNPFQEEA
jgi:hypothetical protein